MQYIGDVQGFSSMSCDFQFINQSNDTQFFCTAQVTCSFWIILMDVWMSPTGVKGFMVDSMTSSQANMRPSPRISGV